MKKLFLYIAVAFALGLICLFLGVILSLYLSSIELFAIV